MSRGAFTLITISIFCFALPQAARAHRSGCHNLHTCPSDTNSYVCGDLGYPCDGSVSIKDILPTAIHVPLVVEKAFTDTFGRTPTDTESSYWKKRFRADKESVHQLRRAMGWHKINNSFGPPAASKTIDPEVIKSINATFRSVYDGRNPTIQEHQYWLFRVQDKRTQQALKDAMAFHKFNNIQH